VGRDNTQLCTGQIDAAATTCHTVASYLGGVTTPLQQPTFGGDQAGRDYARLGRQISDGLQNHVAAAVRSWSDAADECGTSLAGYVQAVQGVDTDTADSMSPAPGGH
jgi:hypothetical protein